VFSVLSVVKKANYPQSIVDRFLLAHLAQLALGCDRRCRLPCQFVGEAHLGFQGVDLS